MGDELFERLQGHSKAFDGLLSLIPAKMYYGEDNEDQWKRKKQSKQEARNAKRAKLDPASAKSAKDVMDENAQKRKREQDDDDDDDDNFEIEGVEKEKPKEGLKSVQDKKSKKQKIHDNRQDTAAEDDAPATVLSGKDAEAERESAASRKAEKQKEKRERKKAKEVAKKEKKEANKRRKEEPGPDTSQKDPDTAPHSKSDDEEGEDPEGDIYNMQIDGIVDEPVEASSAASTPGADSPGFDITTDRSGTSSMSSITAAASIEDKQKPRRDPAELKARLQARIEELRAARRADGIDGKPARNRQELMEARRKKEEERRAKKKELRQKAKQEERERAEEALQRASNSAPGSPMSLHEAENNFSFGRVSFADGQQLDPTLSTLVEPKKRKGPQDALTAVKAAEKKEARINGLDEEKRAEIAEKDAWLNAKKRAHGEKVKDNTSLLKKTLKRKEKAKKKSEKEWNERLEGVQKGIEMRQKKREENLRKRREEKGKPKGKKAPKPGKKVKRRPGFEGSLKAKAGPRT